MLRLLEGQASLELTAAVERALGLGAADADAVAQFLLPREDWRVRPFWLDGREHLRRSSCGPPRCRRTAILPSGVRHDDDRDQSRCCWSTT